MCVKFKYSLFYNYTVPSFFVLVFSMCLCCLKIFVDFVKFVQLNIEARLRNRCCCGKAVIITYLCVCVRARARPVR